MRIVVALQNSYDYLIIIINEYHGLPLSSSVVLLWLRGLTFPSYLAQFETESLPIKRRKSASLVTEKVCQKCLTGSSVTGGRLIHVLGGSIMKSWKSLIAQVLFAFFYRDVSRVGSASATSQLESGHVKSKTQKAQRFKFVVSTTQRWSFIVIALWR